MVRRNYIGNRKVSLEVNIDNYSEVPFQNGGHVCNVYNVRMHGRNFEIETSL